MNIETFIYENNFSLCPDICDDIINNYEEQEFGKYEGVTGGGLQKNIKNTIDFMIPKNNQKWKKINDLLSRELAKNIKEYVNNLNSYFINCNNNEDSNDKFNIIQSDTLQIKDEFMIQKYFVNKGRYIYHNDFSLENKSFRVMTYIWYLNDVDDGGETDFFNGTIKIKPKKGKLILFPASWTFPHCGKKPKSSNKYIITGWIYTSNI